MEKFVGEMMGCAVLDSGCTKTVCGSSWLKCYEESLHPDDLANTCMSYGQSERKFKFGDGLVVQAKTKVKLPVYLSEKKILIETEVVDSELPLLFSKEAMKKVEMTLDFVNDRAKIIGNVVNLEFTSSGHHSLPLTKKRSLVIKDTLSTEDRILVGLNTEDKSYKEKFQIASKLHTQFGHPSLDKLQKLLNKQGLMMISFSPFWSQSAS